MQIVAAHTNSLAASLAATSLTALHRPRFPGRNPDRGASLRLSQFTVPAVPSRRRQGRHPAILRQHAAAPAAGRPRPAPGADRAGARGAAVVPRQPGGDRRRAGAGRRGADGAGRAVAPAGARRERRAQRRGGGDPADRGGDRSPPAAVGPAGDPHPPRRGRPAQRRPGGLHGGAGARTRWCSASARPAPARPISRWPRRWRCCRRARSIASCSRRPAVEAGERLGFLPGDMKEKVDPYLRPLYDALHDMMPADQVLRRHDQRRDRGGAAGVHARPHAGARLSSSWTRRRTPRAVQMKMLLTRMGEGTRMVVTGDLTQIDLPAGVALRPARRAGHAGGGAGHRRGAARQARRGAPPAGGAHRRCLRPARGGAGGQRREARRSRETGEQTGK